LRTKAQLHGVLLPTCERQREIFLEPASPTGFSHVNWRTLSAVASAVAREIFVLEDATIVSEIGTSKLCEAAGRRFWISGAQILPDSDVRHVGDHGRLVLARMAPLPAPARQVTTPDTPSIDLEDLFVIEAAEVVSEGRRASLCKVDARGLWIPNDRILPGSEIRNNGDRGRLVIPRWLAAHLGLEE
jgi:hypothetical protein